MKDFFIFLVFVVGNNFAISQIVCNGSFETPSPSTFPNNHSQVQELDCWEDNKPPNLFDNFHSPDWYMFNQYNIEEDLNNDGFFTSIGGNTGNGYIGMRECEMVYQKLNISLKKDVNYKLRFFYRFPANDFRVEQYPDDDREFQVQPLTIEFYASKKKLSYINDDKRCTDGDDCHGLTGGGTNEQVIVLVELNPTSFQSGSWHLWEGNFSLSGLFNPDFDYFSFQVLNEFEDAENCGTYLLIDDISISEFCLAVDEGCNGCSFVDGDIAVSCNATNTQFLPLTLFGVSNAHTISYSVSQNGQQMLAPTTFQCNNGWLNDLFQIGLPPDFSVGFYQLHATFANNCGECERIFRFYYHDLYDASLNNLCRPSGLIEPCCAEEINTNNDNYPINANNYVVQSISNLFIENTTVNSNANVNFVAGSLIEVLPNTTISSGSISHLYIEQCNTEEYGFKEKAPITQNKNTIEVIENKTTNNVEEIKKIENNEIFVFPNPTSNAFFIQNIKEVADLTIFSSLGIIKYSNKLFPNELKEIDLGLLESGIYYLNFKTNNGKVLIKKVIVL